jgi:wobble nucleotide-excising tRNase
VIRLVLDGGPDARVAEVLSDGERRALTLAFVLAELRVGGNQSAVVLNDPVSSLDQTRREAVSRRLVDEASRRQVVIFMHPRPSPRRPPTSTSPRSRWTPTRAR